MDSFHLFNNWGHKLQALWVATNCRHSGLVPFSKLFCHPNFHRHQHDLYKWFLSWLLREHGNTYWINTYTTIITAAMLLKAHFHLPKANQRDLNWCAHPREPLYWKTHRCQNLCGSSRVSSADWRASPWHKTQHNGISETLGNTTTPISPDFTALSYAAISSVIRLCIRGRGLASI